MDQYRRLTVDELIFNQPIQIIAAPPMPAGGQVPEQVLSPILEPPQINLTASSNVNPSLQVSVSNFLKRHSGKLILLGIVGCFLLYYYFQSRKKEKTRRLR